MKALSLTILILLSPLTPSAKAENEANIDIKKIAEETKSSYIIDNGPNRISILFTRLKRHIITSSITVKKAEKNSATIEWTINKKHTARLVSTFFDMYEGENPEITSSTKKQGGYKRSNLYFYLKPLGQTNGITAAIPTEKEQIFYSNVLANYKVFISAIYKGEEKLIPIIATAGKEGCGQNIFNKKAELLCIQTSHPKDGDLSIGYTQGFSNTVTFSNKIESKDKITTTFKFFYKDQLI